MPSKQEPDTLLEWTLHKNSMMLNVLSSVEVLHSTHPRIKYEHRRYRRYYPRNLGRRYRRQSLHKGTLPIALSTFADFISCISARSWRSGVVYKVKDILSKEIWVPKVFGLIFAIIPIKNSISKWTRLFFQTDQPNIVQTEEFYRTQRTSRCSKAPSSSSLSSSSNIQSLEKVSYTQTTMETPDNLHQNGVAQWH